MKPVSIVNTCANEMSITKKNKSNILATIQLVLGMSYKHFPLILPGVHRSVAPLIMFRLKRRGYSNCRVDVFGGGLIVYAVR